jgi:hypothetical protein
VKIESKSAIISATLYVSVTSALTVVRQQIFVTNSPGLPSVFQDQQIIIIIIIIIIVIISTIITM